MVSGHINSVTLMGGKLTEDRNMAAGYNDIYGPRIYKETDEEEINKLAADQAQHVLGDDVPKKKSPEEFAINNYKPKTNFLLVDSLSSFSASSEIET